MCVCVSKKELSKKSVFKNDEVVHLLIIVCFDDIRQQIIGMIVSEQSSNNIGTAVGLSHLSGLR